MGRWLPFQLFLLREIEFFVLIFQGISVDLVRSVFRNLLGLFAADAAHFDQVFLCSLHIDRMLTSIDLVMKFQQVVFL